MSVEVIAFPGQGEQDKIPATLQYIERHPVAVETIAEADQIVEEIVGQRLISAALNSTADYTDAQTIQAATYSIEVAMFRALQYSEGIDPTLVVGHSLGEYAALVASEVLSFEDGLRLVILRAQAMVEADLDTPGGGGMAAFLGLNEDEILKLADSADVQLANINAPTQMVLSGVKSNLETVVDGCNENVGVRAQMLKIPYAAHSVWMASAADKLREQMPEINFARPKIPILSNRVETLRLAEQFRRHLPEQLILGVNWHYQIKHTINYLGLSKFSEVGPGRTLTGLLKRNFKDSVIIVPVIDEQNNTLQQA